MVSTTENDDYGESIKIRPLKEIKSGSDNGIAGVPASKVPRDSDLKVDNFGKKSYNISTGAELFGAYYNEDSSDNVERKKALKFAKDTYLEISKRNIDFEARRVSENFNNATKNLSSDYFNANIVLMPEDFKLIINHIFNDKHKFKDGKKFDPSSNMAYSWLRLSSGKNIREVDIILALHEYEEIKLLKNNPDMTYDDAHEIVSVKYNY